MSSAWAETNRKNDYVEFGDSANLDSFGRLRVSQPFALNISKFEYSVDAHYWPTLITGAATETHLTNESSVELSVTAAAGDKIIKQTKAYNQYQPGNSQQIMATGVFGPHESGIRKRIGYLDDKNGIFLEQYNGQDRNLQILAPNTARQGRGVLVTPDTGLIRSPEPLDDPEGKPKGDSVKGYKIKTQLNPKIIPGERLVLESAEVSRAEFLIDSVEHVGDNRGQDWYTEATLYEQS